MRYQISPVKHSGLIVWVLHCGNQEEMQREEGGKRRQKVKAFLWRDLV